MQTLNLTIENTLPHDWQRATLVGRVWLPGERGGPAVVLIRDGEVIDCTAHFPTLSLLLPSTTRKQRCSMPPAPASMHRSTGWGISRHCLCAGNG